MAGVLVSNLGNMEKLMDADEDSLMQIREIGPEVAQSIVYFFKQSVNRKTINRLKKACVSFTPVKRATNDLDGMTFIFTGGLEHYTREEAKSLVESRGGKVSSSVSNKTNYLIAGESPGSKLEKAKTLGVKIISEREFRKIIEIEE